MIDTTVCDLSYSLPVGQTVFNFANQSGSAEFDGIASNGCDSVVMVNITYLNLTPVYTVTPGTCTEAGSLLLESFDNNGVPFPVPDLPILFTLTEGDSITIDYPVDPGCNVTETVYIPTAGSEEYMITESDGEINIVDNGTEIDSIVWSPTTGLSCTDCADPIATPDETTTYTAIIYHNGGCTDEVTITIEVETVVPQIIDYYIPNIFSPSGQPANRIFKVIAPTLAEGNVISMNVYDRWGNLMYTSTDSDFLTNGGGWDGTLGGSVVAQGVYVYIVTIVEPDGRIITKQGDVTLLN